MLRYSNFNHLREFEMDWTTMLPTRKIGDWIGRNVSTALRIWNDWVTERRQLLR